MVTVSQLCNYTKYHQAVHFERVSFIVCQLYLDENVVKIKWEGQVYVGIVVSFLYIKPVFVKHTLCYTECITI